MDPSTKVTGSIDKLTIAQELSPSGEAGCSFDRNEARRHALLSGLPHGPFTGTDLGWKDLYRIASRYRDGEGREKLEGLIERSRAREALSSPSGGPALVDCQPAELARRAIALLAPPRRCLGDLFDKAAGPRQDQEWVAPLDEAVRAFLLFYAEKRGLGSAELCADRREARREGPEEVTGAADPAQQLAEPAAAPEDPMEQELGYRVAHHILRYLQEDEKAPLQDHLVMTLAGRPPYKLVRYVRALSERMTEEPEAVRKDMKTWLYIASRLDIDVRWNDIFNVFITAQLPGFLENLHWLNHADLGDNQREGLEMALAYWPVPRPEPPPPPEGVDPEEWLEYGHLAELAFLKQEHQAFFANREGMVCDVEALGTLWERARILLDSLDRLDRILLRQMAEQGLEP